MATEALQACLAWGDQALPFTRTACIIEHGNAPSIRVACKCGFEKQLDSILGENPVGVYTRTRP